MAKFIEFEANPLHNPHKCLINADWIVEVIPNPHDENTSIIYLAVKIDNDDYKVVKGKYEDIKVKLLSL